MNNIRFIILTALLFSKLCTNAQSFKVYSQAGSMGYGPLAIYKIEGEKETQYTDFIYSKIIIVKNTYFIVTDPETESQMLLDKNLAKIIPEGKYSVIDISDDNLNYAVVKSYSKSASAGTYGIFDIKNKKLIVPTKYNYIGDINKNGIVPFNTGGVDMMPQLVQGGKWGYINVNGVELLKPTYTWCSNLNNSNYGTAYVGGNSQDGLYKGHWTLIDHTGKILIDENKYYHASKDPYNTAPNDYIRLKKRNDSYSPEYEKGNVIASCDGKFIKEFEHDIDFIDQTNKLVIVTDNKSNNSLIGIADLNEKLYTDIIYSSIIKMPKYYILSNDDNLFYLFDIYLKKLTQLKVKNVKKISYTSEEEKEKFGKESTWSNSKPWLIMTENEAGKLDFYDDNMNKILTDVDSVRGWKNYVNLDYEKQVGSYFIYYSKHKVNIYSSYLNKILPDKYEDVEPYFFANIYSNYYPYDSVLVRQNNKWGIISAKNFEGFRYMADSIDFVNKQVAIAKIKSEYKILTENKLSFGLGSFTKIHKCINETRYVPGKSGYYNNITYIEASRNTKKYLLAVNRNSWIDGRLSASVIDSGDVKLVDGDIYQKGSKKYFIWTSAELPAGTTELICLKEWTAAADDIIYTYKINGKWGIISEKGKKIKEPIYNTREAVPSNPPVGFKLK